MDRTSNHNNNNSSKARHDHTTVDPGLAALARSMGADPNKVGQVSQQNGQVRVHPQHHHQQQQQQQHDDGTGVVSQVSDLPALTHHPDSPLMTFAEPYTAAEASALAELGGSPMQEGDVSMSGGGVGDESSLQDDGMHHQGHSRRSGSTGKLGIVLGDGGKPIPEQDRPPQGTEEWNQMRRVNHKEVERKRRETINDGINQLASLISKEYAQPERNKGAILRRAASYIEKLKESESIHTERYTLDKLLSDQTIADLQGKLEKMKQECERAWREVDIWKRAAAEAGVKLDEVDVMASIDFPQ